MPSKLYYKAVRKDGTSHYDSKTLWTPGVEIVVPDAVVDSNPCGVGIHGSPTLLGAVGYQGGPSRYLTFEPTSECLGEDKDKARFRSVMPGEWLSAEEIDEIAGFKLHEVNNPVNPRLLEPTLAVSDAVELLKQWASVRASVWDSVRASAGASVWDSVRASVWD